MTKSNHFHLLQHRDALLQKFQGFSLLCIGHLQLPGMPAGYVPSFSWPKLGIYGIYGTQRIMGKEWDITTRIHVHIYILYIYGVMMCYGHPILQPMWPQWLCKWRQLMGKMGSGSARKVGFQRISCRFRSGFYALFLLTRGGPEMGIHQ